MATISWNGDAPAVAQIANASIDTVDGTPADNTFTVTIGGLAISQVGTVDVGTTAAALQVLLAASVDARFSTITWTNPSAGNITGLAKTAGVPFVAALTETGVGTGSVTDFSDTTASSGPNDASTAANWDTGVVPGAGDVTVLENSASSLLYGLDLSGGTMTSFTQRPSFTGTIGLPRNNAGGYVEYRDTYLQIDATLATLDAGGAGRTKIDFGSVQTACTVNGSGTAAESGVPVVLLLGTHASNVVNVNKGSVAVAWFAGEVSTVLTSVVSFLANQSSDSSVTFGVGTTLGTVTVNGGATTIRNNVTTVTQTSGTTTVTGTATVGTLTARGGTVDYRSSGTVTAATVTSGAVLDFRHDLQSRTVTDIDIHAGASVFDTHATVTWTNPQQLVQASLLDVTLNLGTNFTWAFA